MKPINTTRTRPRFRKDLATDDEVLPETSDLAVNAVKSKSKSSHKRKREREVIVIPSSSDYYVEDYEDELSADHNTRPLNRSGKHKKRFVAGDELERQPRPIKRRRFEGHSDVGQVQIQRPLVAKQEPDSSPPRECSESPEQSESPDHSVSQEEYISPEQSTLPEQSASREQSASQEYSTPPEYSQTHASSSSAGVSLSPTPPRPCNWDRIHVLQLATIMTPPDYSLPPRREPRSVHHGQARWDHEKDIPKPSIEPLTNETDPYAVDVTYPGHENAVLDGGYRPYLREQRDRHIAERAPRWLRDADRPEYEPRGAWDERADNEDDEV